MLKKLSILLAGAACGAVIGAAASLLFEKKEGVDLKQQLTERWNYAIETAKEEMARNEQEMTAQFNALKDG